jgi:four helix bundle protein
MAGFKTIEEMNVWKDSLDLVLSIYQITHSNKNLTNDFGLKDQIQRAAVSIPSNIAEGFERMSKQEFIRFLYISKGSCGELRTHLYILLSLKYIKEDEFKELNETCKKISSMLIKLILNLKGRATSN